MTDVKPQAYMYIVDGVFGSVHRHQIDAQPFVSEHGFCVEEVPLYTADEVGLAEKDAVITSKDAEIERLRKLLRGLSDAAELVLAWYEAEEDHTKEPDFYSRVAMCKTSGAELRAALAAVKGEKL